MTDPLAPFARLIADAEMGRLAPRMAAQGLDRVTLCAGSWTDRPDFTVSTSARIVREVLADDRRCGAALWRGVVEKRLAALQAIADALPEPGEELELVIG